ncbi:hypothetical protein [Qipengyuania huizhouensis]|uniref:hypothetical protein n=1 Tax=Qipengyuania huizhouensis TaxID=2867245 RepID=UPI001C88AE8B|nr:hypothetical protein [Qipengyuania huizhouensis]MBX7459570.1 hypothetical protein [Qipengyuania huizhouensis]
MIWTALAAVSSVAKRIPWQVWAILGILLTAWIFGNHRYSQGVDDERDRWEAEQEAAKDKADKATLDAGEKRAIDTIRNTEAERARDEATATGGRIGRDCERLRQAGTDISSIAACAGR